MTEMLTAKELQELLQVDRSTIYRMADAGKLPAIKVGRQWRFPAAQVHAWLGDEAARPEAEPSPPPQLVTAQPDALPVSCVQPLTDLLAELLGVMIVVTDMDGYPVTEVSNPCGLFESVISTPEAVQRCVESWHDLAATIDLEPQLRRSHLGLLCTRGLIRAGTALIGMVFIGGIAPEAWPPGPDEIVRLAEDFGAEPDTIADHIHDVYTLSPDERARLLTFVQRVANVISHMTDERSRLINQLIHDAPSLAR
jgi:excisionase family DNA binding protein